MGAAGDPFAVDAAPNAPLFPGLAFASFAFFAKSNDWEQATLLIT
jgi:hypothetical protein